MSVDVVTFGCRLNACESEVMRRQAQAAGVAGTVIVNTCAVTAEAVRQSRQTVRRIKRERPEVHIVVTGCAAQIEPGSFADMPEVALVLGNEEKLSAKAWGEAWGEAWASLRQPKSDLSDFGHLECRTRVNPSSGGGGSGKLPHHHSQSHAIAPPAFGASAEDKIKVNDIMAVRETAAHLVDGFDGRVRAFVQVQNGCNHRCTFCIIPYGRGNSRSVPMGEVVAQVRGLCERGCREVVLTGVDLTGYGSNLPGAPRLGLLVRQILRHVPELARLRLSSIDSVEVDRDLLDALANESRLMPHLHLSLQAGDDLILKRMKRRHSRADAIAFCARLRRLRPDVVLGADMIAGFPTETEDMFARSLDLVDACGLTHLHVFPFSPRPGTPAARMPQVAIKVVKERARRLREKGSTALAQHLETKIGSTCRVLTVSRECGHTEQFTPVRLNVPAAAGALVDLKIAGHDGRQLLAA
jgi:threonylcarbamoyladenosine tRNA methylthiotransferase MtaB